MTNPTIKQFNEQFETYFAKPTRAFSELATSHLESLANTQVEAARSYSEFFFSQTRSALSVKSPEDVKAYVAGQQDAVKELGERLKGDAEKVVNLHSDFAEKAQKLTEETTKSAAKAAGQSK